MRRLFIDLDGVLADFDGQYERCFGIHLDRNAEDPPGFWDHIRAHGSFYRDLPLLPDALDLWRGAKRLHPSPVILSGVSKNVPESREQKAAWIKEHLGPDVPQLFCASRDKRMHGRPGDVLIDDWHKYRGLWQEMGGVFVLHTSAADSLARTAPLFAIRTGAP